MTDASAVLLLHEGGELDDVAGLLRGLGIAYEERSGSSGVGPIVLPTDLLVADGRRALSLPPPPRGAREGRAAARIAVVGSDSQGLRAKLREVGFDVLVRRPVHPTALRLLLLRYLYRGPERREGVRVPVGAPVRFRSFLRWRRGVLTEVSTGGCRLLAPRALRPGRRVVIEIPDGAGRGATARVRGRVVRANGFGPSDPTASIALAFVSPSAAARKGIDRLLQDHLRGPASPAAGWDLEEPATVVPAVEATSPVEPEDRRTMARSRYRARVVTLGEQAAHVVMGCDLSLGGIRIERHGGLEVGQALSLALHGAGTSVPLVLQGRVLRDDGARGLVIRFDEGSPAQTEALTKLIAGLGAIDALDGPEATPAILTEVDPSGGARAA